MANLNLGSMPVGSMMAYVHHAGNFHSHGMQAEKAMAKSSHPAFTARKAEFADAALSHAEISLGHANSMKSISRTMAPAENLQGRAANFEQSRNAHRMN